MADLDRLRDFVPEMTLLMARAGCDEAATFAAAEPLLAAFVGHDEWLPEAAAETAPEGYRQDMPHCDPLDRFSAVNFMWSPGARTPSLCISGHSNVACPNIWDRPKEAVA